MEETIMLFLTSARENDVKKIKAMVEAGLPVSTSNTFRQSALHIASLCGSLEAVQVLLDLGCSPNLTNQVLGTPLHYAAAAPKNALEVCKLLLAAGADPQAADQNGTVPFERAQQEEVRRLLGGPDTRIFSLCSAGDAEGLRTLLASGEVHSLFVTDIEGTTPLNLAVKAKSAETVKAILAFNRDCVKYPDSQGNTPLHVAVEEGDAEMVGLLLTYKPNVDMPNLNSSEYAEGNWKLGGEDLEPYDKTPLHLAAEAGDTEIAKLLVAAGASVNELDFDRAAPLHLALEMQDEPMVELLVQSGADVNLQHPDFSTPLHLAAYQGPLSTLEILLKAGADVRALAPGDGATPLLYAARAGKLPKVQALLTAGADVKAANKQGDTALHLAAVNGHRPVVEALLAAGADRAAANPQGKTPAALAKTPELKQLLQ